MSSPSFFLRRDVAVEPTVHRWYAWAHLVAPATSALHLARSQLPILDSFVRSPLVHAAALKDPKMRGGPFLDFDAQRASEIAALAAELRRAGAKQLEFAAAVAELDKLLAQEAKGFSLEPLYERVPEPLRGLVELVYDTSSRAGWRLIEPLAYRSELYASSAQRLLMRRLRGDDRTFVLSTPRLASDVDVEIERPFRDASLDELYRMRDAARQLEELREVLGLSRDRDDVLRSMLTETPPPAREAWTADGLRVRYFGHACVLLETRATSVLIDPLIGYGGFETDAPRYGFEDLPAKIDFVLITHGHQDHLVLESLLPLRHKIGTVVVPRAGGGAIEDPSLKLVLEAVGFRRVVELDELETIAVDGGEIVGLPFLGEHGDLRVRTKLAHLVRLGGKTLVFAADSCNVEPRLYERVREIAGDVDVLFLGMECDGAPMSWLYGAVMSSAPTRAMDQSRRLCGSDHVRGMGLVERLAPQRVYVYAMGQEPWCAFITSIKYTDDSAPIVESNRLIERCRERGVPAERLFGRSEMPFGR